MGPKIRLIKRAVKVAQAVLKVIYLKILKNEMCSLNGKSKW